MVKVRKNSFAFCGGAFGDEGKGRIVDEYVSSFLRRGSPVYVYRDNGGANAGHTVETETGQKMVMHLLPSGVLSSQTKVILGKGMVIHPQDLMTEIEEVKTLIGTNNMAQIIVDPQAVLSLDTHRAFEGALKAWQEGGRGATGRGISPAYADVLLRHPLRICDLVNFDEDKITKHYRLYQALLSGLNIDIKDAVVARYGSPEPLSVGTEKQFIDNLRALSSSLKNYSSDVSSLLKSAWSNEFSVFIFEKAQSIGLDYRWGVYPDVTASDTTFEGIYSATEGIIDPLSIETKAAVIKATYMSSVGTRVLPTTMDEGQAHRIREDANEYGATTKRPRDIYHLDLPALKFFAKVGRVDYHILTHMDIVYPSVPVRVCVGYVLNGQECDYRPDQEFLFHVKPIYQDFEPWDKAQLQQATTYQDLPQAAKTFLEFIGRSLGTKISLITTGSQRHQSLYLPL